MQPAQAAAAVTAHKRVKRAMGLLRQAAASLAADVDVDLVGELELRRGDSLDRLLELVAIARHRHGDIDVVILSRPGPRGSH